MGLAYGLSRRPGLLGAGAVFWLLSSILLATLCVTWSLPASVEQTLDDQVGVELIAKALNDEEAALARGDGDL